jgi:hypothetical protein
LELVSAADLEQPLGDGDVGAPGIDARRERIGVRIVHDPDPGPRDPRRDRHLLHDVHELFLLRVVGIDDLRGAGSPQHLLWTRPVGVPRGPQGDE